MWVFYAPVLLFNLWSLLPVNGVDIPQSNTVIDPYPIPVSSRNLLVGDSYLELAVYTDAKYDEDVKCADALSDKNVSDHCEVVQNVSDCAIDGAGFINYVEFFYCVDFSRILAGIILALWLVYLFISIKVVAQRFFCPSLDSLATMKCGTRSCSRNVAGVTLLAWGNGSPDIIIATVAATKTTSAEDNDLGLVIGGLFGAGIFITTIVISSILIFSPKNPIDSFKDCLNEMRKPPFKLERFKSMRDVFFYLVACSWAYYVVNDGNITTGEAAGFISLYIGYVLLVLLWGFLSSASSCCRQGSADPEEKKPLLSSEQSDDEMSGDQQAKKPNGDVNELEAQRPPVTSDSAQPQRDYDRSIEATENGPTDDMPLETSSSPDSSSPSPWTPSVSKKAVLTELLLAICPIDIMNWKEMDLLSKFMEIVQVPVVLLVTLTTPVVDRQKKKNNWNRILNSLHCILALTFALFVTGIATISISKDFLIWHLVLPIGAIMCLVVFFTSKFEEAPRYHLLGFSLFGFIICIVWIYVIATEVVNLLKTIGLLLNLSDEFMGQTFLTFGNSLPDLVNNTTNARRRPQPGETHPGPMSISACFGGPLVTMLLGFGLSSLIGTIMMDSDLKLDHLAVHILLYTTVAVSLVSTLIMIGVKSSLLRGYSFYLITLFILYIIVTILIETNTIPNELI
ncbi:mitochondrial sodium/calcium exchanger protein-like isoform X2 [Ptychodera flava]|uniref:mitochondrial sodium/calcium exchanger protein-like isoform X2 n=1 Tax=Ptychodera flava TaxID=63121 RepID=UPI00396A7FE6